MRTYKTPKFEIGDKIAYSVQFLKSIGMSHSDMAHARGTIRDLIDSMGIDEALSRLS